MIYKGLYFYTYTLDPNLDITVPVFDINDMIQRNQQIHTIYRTISLITKRTVVLPQDLV